MGPGSDRLLPDVEDRSVTDTEGPYGRSEKTVRARGSSETEPRMGLGTAGLFIGTTDARGSTELGARGEEGGLGTGFCTVDFGSKRWRAG